MTGTAQVKTQELLTTGTAQVKTQEETRGFAIAEEPRDALRQLKYYGRF